jgi:hypothetical protein
MDHSILPPTVPSNEEELNGTFLYIKDTHTRKMLVNAYQAIQLTESWEYIKKDYTSNGFAFYSSGKLQTIFKKMEEFPNSVGHSGFSANWTLNQMRFIANQGEYQFKEEYLRLHPN